MIGTKPITLGDGTCKLSIAFASNAANAVGTQVESEAQKAVSAIQAKCASGAFDFFLSLCFLPSSFLSLFLFPPFPLLTRLYFTGIGSASFCGVTTQGLNLGIVTISPATV